MILSLIHEKNRVYVAELSERFNVSEVTIRKDLQDLEERGEVRRVHGGAVNIYKTGVEPTLLELERINIDVKRAIAATAYNYINNDDVIFMDASTTTRDMVPLIARHTEKRMTIITSSIVTAMELSNIEHVRLILLGGNVRGTLCCVEGIYANNLVHEFHADKLFFGANGFDVSRGVTIANINASLLKREMINNSDQIFLLADSSKHNCVTISRVCPMNRVDYLITDDRLSAEEIVRLEQEG